jgi:nitrogen fixation protein FixH
MSKSSGRVWPYAIGLAITMVFGFCVATIMVTQKANIQVSDAYMTHYQDADANANDLIKAQIEFDKKYKIEYLTDRITKTGSVIQYRLTDINSNPINDATIMIATSRPETSEFNQKIENPQIKDGIYSFSGVTFPKDGVWNIIAKINRGQDSRFLNIKADTRNEKIIQF